MATPSRGIGKGGNSGGRNNPPGGRPKGAIHKKARDLIAEAERTGQLLPIDYLLSVMRDPDAAPRDRAYAAVAAAPYCHARLTALQVMPDVRTMGEMELQVHLSRLEQQAALLPASEHSLTDQLDGLLENLDQVPYKRREALFRRLFEVGEAGLRELHDPNRPGAVPPRTPWEPPQRVNSEEAPMVMARPMRSAHQRAPDTPSVPLDGQRWRYNSDSGKLEPA